MIPVRCQSIKSVIYTRTNKRGNFYGFYLFFFRKIFLSRFQKGRPKADRNGIFLFSLKTLSLQVAP